MEFNGDTSPSLLEINQIILDFLTKYL
jgi:hypothetical protein